MSRRTISSDAPAAGAIFGDVVWTPDQDVISRSRLRRFMDKHRIVDYRELHARSVADLEWFWNAAILDLGLEFYEPYREVLDIAGGPEWARWFIGGRLNIVHSCLDRHRDSPRAAKTALIWESEAGETREITYAELFDDVCRFAAALRDLGVTRGDRVGIFMPMLPEAAVALLAAAKLGAVSIPLFSGYGPDAVATRLNDGGAKVLICADGYLRRGKEVRMKDVADQAVANVPSVSTVVVVERTGTSTQWNAERDRAWARLLADADGRVETEPLDSDAPLMIIHTSGTTGRPKGTVHAHSGFPLKALQDLVHGMDGDEDDVLFWFSDFGWMMGPWVVFATLALGATMVLYDGAPETPGPDRLWTLIDRHQVSIFGLSPTLARSLIPSGGEVVAQHDLRSLRVVGSAGEVWDPNSWMWTFDHVCRGRIPLLNYCGGTEVSGGIVCGNVLTPLRPCSFAGPLPGMAADVVDQDGHSIRGRPGELVLRAPNPGMTRGFWRDRERYLESYWSWLPGLWRHGDAALVDDRDGLWYVLGRSDDTMKIAGKRVGPGEVEAILMRHPDVEAAAAIGVPDPLKGEALACIVVPRRRGSSADEAALAAELSDAVAKALGKATRPAQVRVVADLPRTRSGKIVRRAMRSVLAGDEPGDLSAVENPEALAALVPFARSAPDGS